MSCTCSWGQSETCSHSQLPSDLDSWPIESHSFWAPLMQDTQFLTQLVYPPGGMPAQPFYAQPPPPPTYAYEPNSYAPARYPTYAYQPQDPYAPAYNNHPPGPKPKRKGATLRKKRRPKPSSLGYHHRTYHHQTIRDATQQRASYARRARGHTPNGAEYAQAMQYLQGMGITAIPRPSTQTHHRKPRTWRGGYRSPSTKKTLGSYLTKLLPRSATFYRPFRLNPVLGYNTRHRPLPVMIDLRWDPLAQLSTLHPTINLLAPATSPPLPRMHLWHKSLPWYINIEASSSISSEFGPVDGVTLLDVLNGIHAELARPIGSHEYYNSLLTSADREALGLAFQRRCRGDLNIITKGICRVDFLGLTDAGVDMVWLAGLEEMRDGMWELKTAPRPEQITQHARERMIIE